MLNQLFFIALASLWQLATATAYSVLEPVSDEGSGNNLLPRSLSQIGRQRASCVELTIRWKPIASIYVRILTARGADSGDNIFVNMVMSSVQESVKRKTLGEF